MRLRRTGFLLLASATLACSSPSPPPAPPSGPPKLTQTTAPGGVVSRACETIQLELIESRDAFPGIGCDGDTLHLEVAEAWHFMPCYKRLDLAIGLDARWRQLDGTAIMIRYNGREVASSSLAGTVKVVGCPQ